MHNPDSKTPINYYGGKTSLLAHILPLVPPHDVYTECFFGGGSVFFAKQKVKNETINDKSDIVINFYEQLKLHYHDLKKLIDSTLLSRTQHLRGLSMVRNKENYSPLQLAWAFWMVTNFSFSNKIGGGIKYSNTINTVVPDVLNNKKKRFTLWLAERLEGAHIECSDALFVLDSRNVKKAFHYIDPPYFNADQGHYPGYTIEHYIQLLEQCEKLKGYFLLSSYDSPELQEFIKKNNWFQKSITKRLQAPKIKNRDKTEILICNYTPTSLVENLFYNEHHSEK